MDHGKFFLGALVVDKRTGLEATVVAHCYWLDEGNTIGLRRGYGKDNPHELSDVYWVHESRLKLALKEAK